MGSSHPNEISQIKNPILYKWQKKKKKKNQFSITTKSFIKKNGTYGVLLLRSSDLTWKVTLSLQENHCFVVTKFSVL